MTPLHNREIHMADPVDKPSPGQKPARTNGTEPANRKAEEAKADPHDDGDTRQPGASRPRGKTEDPDRTL
jgi:hypothetical protein